MAEPVVELGTSEPEGAEGVLSMGSSGITGSITRDIAGTTEARTTPLLNRADEIDEEPQSRMRSCLQYCISPRRSLDSWTANYIRRSSREELPNPMPNWLDSRIRRIRNHLVIVLLFITLAVGLIVFTAIKGWIMVLLGAPSSCDALSSWVFWFSAAISLLPILFAIVGPYALWLSVNGHFIVEDIDPECCQARPALCEFAQQVMWLTGVAVIFILCAAVAGFFLSRRLEAARRMLGSSGPAAEAVLAHVASSRAPTAAQLDGVECAICLEGAGRPSQWRQLPCEHFYHLSCLTEWLKRSRRCPLCRLDLQREYFGGGLSPDPAPVTPTDSGRVLVVDDGNAGE